MVVEDAASGQAQELSMDIYSPDFLANPFPSYAELRCAEPIAMLSRYGVWAVGRYDDVQAILRDPATYCSSGGASLRNYFKEKPWRTPSLLMETDAPVHTRARAVVARI